MTKNKNWSYYNGYSSVFQKDPDKEEEQISNREFVEEGGSKAPISPCYFHMIYNGVHPRFCVKLVFKFSR